MRYPNSTFNHFCSFINSLPVGTIYRTRDMHKKVGTLHTDTRARIQSSMKSCHFIKWVKQGHWKITRHVPLWFDSAHAKLIKSGYVSDMSQPNGMSRTYQGLTRVDIILLLLNNSNPKQNFFPNHLDTSKSNTNDTNELDLDKSLEMAIRKAFPANIEGSPEFNSANTSPTIVKIDRSESAFANQPKREINTREIVNIGLVMASISSLDQIKTTDSVLHARVLNAISILKDLESSMTNKVNAQLFNGKL